MNPIQLLAVLALGGTLLVACNPKDPVDENAATAPAPADVPPATDTMPPADTAPTDMPPPPDGSTPTDPAQEPAPPPNS
jgi:hypothetical protein